MQRLSPRLRSQQFFLSEICGECFFPKFIEICMEMQCWYPSMGGHQYGGWKPTETSVNEFCYKSINLSLEELKNIKIILFLNVQIAKFPEIRHFLNKHDSSYATQKL